MLTGPALGAAIKAAIEKKKIPQTVVASAFGVKPPSITDWIKRGTISKDKLPQLWAFFADVVGPEHWGLASFPTPPHAQEAMPTYLPRKSWPFERIDPDKLLKLSGADARSIENALLTYAGDFGIDLRYDGAAKASKRR